MITKRYRHTPVKDLEALEKTRRELVLEKMHEIAEEIQALEEVHKQVMIAQNRRKKRWWEFWK
jgi:hypothetical protein